MDGIFLVNKFSRRKKRIPEKRVIDQRATNEHVAAIQNPHERVAN